jgi:transcriptional antiterminator NusG
LYFIVRVTASQEKITSDIIQNKAAKGANDIYSIIMPFGMKGYVVIEAASEIACRDLILNEPHVKGMLSKPLEESELEKMLSSKQATQQIAINDVIEFFGGPFKGYKAKVIKTDSGKDEITVELMDVAVPIPVTTKSNMARIIQKANQVI